MPPGASGARPATRPTSPSRRPTRSAGAPVRRDLPITGYEQLTAAQVQARLKDLTKADLRKVRTQEKRGKARKGVLDSIEIQLAR